MTTRRRPVRLLCAAVVLAAASGAGAAPPSGLEQVQKEFKTAIDRGTPATVTVIAKDSRAGCSGVLVTRGGLVLSDFDAQLVFRSGRAPDSTDQVKVRVPEMKSGTFIEYDGRIVRVLKDVDSTLIQITNPPPGGFKFLAPASAEGLHVGSFTFASGNSFGSTSEALPSMTAGVLTAVTYLPPKEAAAAGRFEHLYTAAAVTPGVSGGPLLDVQGRLVGVISGCEPVTPDGPYQFLGKAIPVDRLRAAYASVPEAKNVFGDGAPKSDESKVAESTALESVVAHVATETYASVASLVIERTVPLNSQTVGDKGLVAMPRYLGPASAVAVSSDGWLVTSLYNLTNTIEMLPWGQGAPPAMHISAGLGAITKITAEFPDGSAGEARIVARHEGLGIALLKADVIGRRPVEPAPATAFQPGRFLVSVANPYGEKPLPEPLANVGVVSKRHKDDIEDPWRGQIQTDAGATDGNCGAAVVDLDGKLVGVLTLWDPIHHGRNSGVAFVVPWDKIQLVLLAMEDGRSFRLPLMGVMWVAASDEKLDRAGPPRVKGVIEGGPAAKAGVMTEDLLVKIGDVPVKSIEDVTKAFVGHWWSGDRVPITVSRGGKEVVCDVELGARD